MEAMFGCLLNNALKGHFHLISVKPFLGKLSDIQYGCHNCSPRGTIQLSLVPDWLIYLVMQMKTSFVSCIARGI